MSGFEEQAYPVFELFSRQWALVTAGTAERFNSCTVAWGSMGTLWTRPGSTGAVMTVYLHPARYTRDVMLDSEYDAGQRILHGQLFPAKLQKGAGRHGLALGTGYR